MTKIRKKWKKYIILEIMKRYAKGRLFLYNLVKLLLHKVSHSFKLNKVNFKSMRDLMYFRL